MQHRRHHRRRRPLATRRQVRNSSRSPMRPHRMIVSAAARRRMCVQSRRRARRARRARRSQALRDGQTPGVGRSRRRRRRHPHSSALLSSHLHLRRRCRARPDRRPRSPHASARCHRAARRRTPLRSGPPLGTTPRAAARAATTALEAGRRRVPTTSRRTFQVLRVRPTQRLSQWPARLPRRYSACCGSMARRTTQSRRPPSPA